MRLTAESATCKRSSVCVPPTPLLTFSLPMCVAPAQLHETGVLVHNGRCCGLLHGLQGQRRIGKSLVAIRLKDHIWIAIWFACTCMSSLNCTYPLYCAYVYVRTLVHLLCAVPGLVQDTSCTLWKCTNPIMGIEFTYIGKGSQHTGMHSRQAIS